MFVVSFYSLFRLKEVYGSWFRIMMEYSVTSWVFQLFQCLFMSIMLLLKCMYLYTAQYKKIIKYFILTSKLNYAIFR